MSQSVAAAILLQARDHAGLSQRETADAAGTSQSVVGRIEAGLASPSVDTLARLIQATGFELKLVLEPVQVADPVIEAYKAEIDQSGLAENLRASVDKRLRANGDGRA